MDGKIQRIVNPRIINFTSLTPGMKLSSAVVNDSEIILGLAQNIGDPITATVDVPGYTNTCYVVGKIDNANPLKLKTGGVLGAGTLAFITSTPVEFFGSPTLLVYYDGIDTYLFATHNFNKKNGTSFVSFPCQTILRNLQ
ncbi:MAG: hypothetical protein HFI31_06920 [Lachnospiraceae bacterium]|nr:hypothetical protein [Lachnospiraceae bacterium]